MSCPEYSKIETLYDRGDDFKIDTGRVRRPEFAIPGSWLVTEKIDGTNVRVSLELNEGFYYRDGSPNTWAVRFYGRTEKAQMPTFLLEHLQKTFTLEKMRALWRCKKSCDECGGEGWTDATDVGRVFCSKLDPYPIVLYGEGYGARIQKGGGDYRHDGDVSLRLFDVLIGGIWLRRTDVEDVARQLGVEPVPLITPVMSTDEIIELVRTGFGSYVAGMEGTARMAEGVVAFTDPPLFNSRGQRLMWKLKSKDFA